MTVVLLSILGIILIAFIVVVAYAVHLMWGRPPMKLYKARSIEPDFTPLSEIPKKMADIIIRLEDGGFYRHHGFNLLAMEYAFLANFKAKSVVLGGSTITQQLAKNLYFRFNSSYLRKATELVIGQVLEHRLGKDKILEFYLNIIYFGNGVYGITDAAKFYFNKPVSELTLNQMVLLACIPAAPTRGNPIQYPEVFERLRNKRLRLLLKIYRPLITREEEDQIRAMDAKCLDPELRKPDDFTRNFPDTIPLINERFGPFSNVSEV